MPVVTVVTYNDIYENYEIFNACHVFGNVPHVKLAEHRAYPPEYPYRILVALT